MNLAYILVGLVMSFLVPFALGEPQPTKSEPGNQEKKEQLPDGVLMRIGPHRVRHENTILSVAFKADGKTLVSAGAEGRICTWDAALGKQLDRIQHEAMFQAASLSHDGKLGIAVDTNGKVNVWNIENKKLLWSKEGPKNAHHCRVSPSKEQIAILSQQGLFVWDIAKKKSVAELPPSKVRADESLAFSPNSKMLAVRNNQGILLLETESLKEIRSIKSSGDQLQFDPEGKTLLESDPNSGSITCWDLETGKKTASFKGKLKDTTLFACSADGKILCATNDSKVRLWDKPTGKKLHDIDLKDDSVELMAISSDGKLLAVGNDNYMIRLYDTSTGKSIAVSPGHEMPVTSVAYTPDGKQIITSGEDSAIHVWDRVSGKHFHGFHRHKTSVDALAVSNDGALLVSVSDDGIVCIWDLVKHAFIREQPAIEGGMHLVGFLPDGQFAVLSFESGQVKIYNPTTGKESGRFETRAGNDGISVASFTPDARYLCVDHGQSAGVWDVAAGKKLAEFPCDGAVTSVALSGDGKTTALMAGSQIVLWETGTKKKRLEFRIELESWGCGFSPDGALLVVVGQKDEKEYLTFCDAYSGKILKEYKVSDEIMVAEFSPSGDTLLTGSMDCGAWLWDVSRLRPKNEPVKAEKKILTTLWERLNSKDAENAYGAITELRQTGGSGVEFLMEQMKPIPSPDAKRIDKLLADLDAEDFEVREKASRELEQLGSQVEPAMKKLLQTTTSLEVRQRLEKLLERVLVDGLDRQTLRALEVLEAIASREAVKGLEQLVKQSSGTWLESEASAALSRIKRREK